MHAFVADFIKEYSSTGLPPADISCINFGWLGAYLHLALYLALAQSDAKCDSKKPPIEVYTKKVLDPDDDKFVSDDTPECQLPWDMATDSVFELADANDNGYSY